MAVIVKNKQIGFDYKIVEEFEAGLVLSGQEVKSIKSHHISLKGSFVSIKNNNAWLKKMHLPPYAKSSLQSLKNYNPNRDRKLLLNKREMAYLSSKTNERGLTIVPISV